MNSLLLPPTGRTATVGFLIERTERLASKRITMAARCAAEPSPKNLGISAALTSPILGRICRS